MENKIYSEFAAFYDKLINDVDYNEWMAFILKEFELAGVQKGASVIDLACGTGAFANRLACAGYDLIGVDISDEMLSIASAKAAKLGVSDRTLYIKQDMRTIDLFGTSDAAVCCLDGINYLKNKKDLFKTFSRLKYFLNPGALFIFDVNTPYKFENILANSTFVYDCDDVFCTWENDYNKKSKNCYFNLTFFAKDKNSLWHRSGETQCEHAFSDSEIISALTFAGFGDINIYSDFSHSPTTSSDERHYFICRLK